MKWKQKKLVILQAGYLLKSNKLISTQLFQKQHLVYKIKKVDSSLKLELQNTFFAQREFKNVWVVDLISEIVYKVSFMKVPRLDVVFLKTNVDNYRKYTHILKLIETRISHHSPVETRLRKIKVEKKKAWLTFDNRHNI